MAEETTSTTGEEQKPDDAKQGEEQKQQQGSTETKTDADIEAIAAKAENPDAVRTALKAERAAAKEARERADKAEAEVRKYQDKDKTEQQRAEDSAKTEKERADKAEAKLLRFQVAAEKKLPMDLADRLQGNTKAQLEADADRLLELVKPSDKPSGDADAGKGEGGSGKSFNDLMRAAAR